MKQIISYIFKVPIPHSLSNSPKKTNKFSRVNAVWENESNQ